MKPKGVSLSAEQMVECTDTILKSWDKGKKGWLFILRNTIPVSLLGEEMGSLSGATPHYSEDKVREFLNGLKERSRSLQEGKASMTILLPENTKGWFLQQRATFSPKNDIPEGLIPDSKRLKHIWRSFQKTWLIQNKGEMRWFKAGVYNDDPRAAYRTDIAGRIYRSRKLDPSHSETYKIVVNTLPNIWLYISETVVDAVCRKTRRGRIEIEEAFSKWVLGFTVEVDNRGNEEKRWLSLPSIAGQHGTQDKFRKWLEGNDIRIMKVAAIKYANPRLAGWEILNLEEATNLVIHSALAYEMSRLAKARNLPLTTQ